MPHGECQQEKRRFFGVGCTTKFWQFRQQIVGICRLEGRQEGDPIFVPGSALGPGIGLKDKTSFPSACAWPCRSIRRTSRTGIRPNRFPGRQGAVLRERG